MKKSILPFLVSTIFCFGAVSCTKEIKAPVKKTSDKNIPVFTTATQTSGHGGCGSHTSTGQ